jgi:acyl-CoA reductase-like NAD-dependent aldehyde dehydrogenase
LDTRLIEAPASGETRDYKMFIGGEWVDSLSWNTFESINPYTGRAWATAPEAGEEDVDRAVRTARAAFDEGAMGHDDRHRAVVPDAAARGSFGRERARVGYRRKNGLREAPQDNGRPAGVGGRVVLLLRGATDKFQGETVPSDKPNFFVYTRREPLGVVGAIAPWHSPLLLLIFKLARRWPWAVR